MLFDQYKSMLGTPAPTKPLPPENVRVLIRSSLSKAPIEAMIVRSPRRAGLRWCIFGFKGSVRSYPYRGFEPDSWEFISE